MDEWRSRTCTNASEWLSALKCCYGIRMSLTVMSCHHFIMLFIRGWVSSTDVWIYRLTWDILLGIVSKVRSANDRTNRLTRPFYFSGARQVTRMTHFLPGDAQIETVKGGLVYHVIFIEEGMLQLTGLRRRGLGFNFSREIPRNRPAKPLIIHLLVIPSFLGRGIEISAPIV